MTRALWSLLLLTLLGCAHGAVRAPARAGQRNGKLASRVWSFASGRQCDLRTLQCTSVLWRASGWSRMADMVAPVYAVEAGDGTACPVWQTLVDTPEEQHYWVCAEAWRVRSNGSY